MAALGTSILVLLFQQGGTRSIETRWNKTFISTIGGPAESKDVQGVVVTVEVFKNT
jgi:hypothetical protein